MGSLKIVVGAGPGPGKVEAGADDEEYLNRWAEVKGFHLGMETHHPAFTSQILWGMFYYPHFMEEAAKRSQEYNGERCGSLPGPGHQRLCDFKLLTLPL